MLSRTADHIFWMARYMERAENLARLLDVNSRMLLMPQTPQEIQQLWLATLDTIGLLESYGQQQGTVAPDQVAHYLALDRANPGSIFSCLQLARENAHAAGSYTHLDVYKRQPQHPPPEQRRKISGHGASHRAARRTPRPAGSRDWRSPGR